MAFTALIPGSGGARSLPESADLSAIRDNRSTIFFDETPPLGGSISRIEHSVSEGGTASRHGAFTTIGPVDPGGIGHHWAIISSHRLGRVIKAQFIGKGSFSRISSGGTAMRLDERHQHLCDSAAFCGTPTMGFNPPALRIIAKVIPGRATVGVVILDECQINVLS